MELSSSWEENFPIFHGARKFIKVFTKALHLSLSWARSIQPITPSYRSKIHFNSILPPTSRFSYLSLSFWLSHQNPVCIHFRPHACCMLCPSHPPWIDYSNYIWWRVQVMKLLNMQVSPASLQFISLLSKYSPQHPLSNILGLQVCSFLNIRDLVSHPYETTSKIIGLCTLNFMFLQTTKSCRPITMKCVCVCTCKIELRILVISTLLHPECPDFASLAGDRLSSLKSSWFSPVPSSAGSVSI
jgi:hypothetical protein